MINKDHYVLTQNHQPVKMGDVPCLETTDFRKLIVEAVKGEKRIASFFGYDVGKSDQIGFFVVLADDESGELLLSRTVLQGSCFDSITPDCPEAHLFEREIAEQYGIEMKGHPWFKPVRYHASWSDRDAWKRPSGELILPAVGDFFRVEGEQVHEVAVGPVHAGIIEPGHFRFQCHGENVFHLEIALGFQHRGIENHLLGGPDKRALHYLENTAGDTSIGHTGSYASIIEALSETQAPPRGLLLRAVALELERLANHVGDLGALSGDIGYLPTSSFNGRLRGDFLNLTALLCGNRFGRGMVIPGGVHFDVDNKIAQDLLKNLKIIEKETMDSIELLWNNQSVLSRIEGTGTISRDTAVELGLVGPAARACGLVRDARYSHPSGIYRYMQIPVSTLDTGDVFARAYIRYMEIRQAIAFIKTAMGNLPAGDCHKKTGMIAPDSVVVSMVEGWRGEICHTAITDANSRFLRYKIVDPSFHNWFGLAMAQRNQEISDFPLINKSFSLSYCGFDL